MHSFHSVFSPMSDPGHTTSVLHKKTHKTKFCAEEMLNIYIMCFGKKWQLGHCKLLWLCELPISACVRVPALQRGCVQAVCVALLKLGDFLITLGWHSCLEQMPVCLWDVFTSSGGNVMLSAFPPFLVKVKLIQSLVDDSHHSVPFCTDAEATARRNGPWLDEVCEVSAASASQCTCEIISHSNSPYLWISSASAPSCFVILSINDVFDFSLFLDVPFWNQSRFLLSSHLLNQHQRAIKWRPEQTMTPVTSKSNFIEN